MSDEIVYEDVMDDEAAELLLADAVNDSRTADEYKAEIKQLRKEAASNRVKGRDKAAALEGELNEYRQWKESQKSELDRALDRASMAEQNLAALAKEKLQVKAAKAAGLDIDLADRIRGDSEDEMLADAKLLAEKAKTTAPSPLMGKGTPVRAPRGSDEEANDFFRNILS